jgi:hypothetical protein
MKTRQDTITTDFQKASISVSDLTNELAVVSDALEDIKVPSLCCARCGGGVTGVILWKIRAKRNPGAAP